MNELYVPLEKAYYLACVVALWRDVKLSDGSRLEVDPGGAIGFCEVYESKEAAEAAHPGASVIRIGQGGKP